MAPRWLCLLAVPALEEPVLRHLREALVIEHLAFLDVDDVVALDVQRLLVLF